MVKVADKVEGKSEGKKSKEAKAKANGKSEGKAVAKKAKPETPANYGVERDHDVKWSEKKVAFYKLLKKQGEGTATELAEASGGKLSSRDIRHYGYCGQAGGLVTVNQYEKDEATGHGGANRYYFALSAAGKKIDPDKELAKQNKSGE